MGADEPRARSTKNKARLDRYNELASQDFDERDDAADIQIVPGAPLGELVIRRGEAFQGVRRHPAVRGFSVLICRGAELSASSVPTGPAKQRCSR